MCVWGVEEEEEDEEEEEARGGVDQCSCSDSACGGGHTSYRRLSERSVLNVNEGATQLIVLALSWFVRRAGGAVGGVDLLLASPIIHHNKMRSERSISFVPQPVERTNSPLEGIV